MIIFVVSSLLIGIIVGYLGQRSRFCTMAAIRNLIILRNTDLFKGLFGLLLGGTLGFTLFSFLTPQSFQTFPLMIKANLPGLSILILALIGGVGLGLFSTYSDGCPFRMHVRSGTGDLEAMAYLIGFYVGIVYYLFFVQDIISFFISLF
ncbi:MAG: YeeE/YedE thiosulfate transporter family protein [Nitrososphaeria archaeon]